MVVVTGMDWWTEKWTKHDIVDYTYYVVVIGSEFGGHEVSFLLKSTIQEVVSYFIRWICLIGTVKTQAFTILQEQRIFA